MTHDHEKHCKSSAGSDTSIDSDDVVIVDAAHPYSVREPHSAKQLRRVEVQDLVSRANEYVTVSPQGVATVAPAIKKVMSHGEVQWVEHMVDIHNLVRVRYKFPEGTIALTPFEPSSTPSDGATTSQALDAPPPAPTPCVPHVSFTFYWWGFRIYMDHCFCNMLKLVGNFTGGAGVVIGLFAAAGFTLANPYIALAAGLIAMMIGWITWADGYCTPNMGANYNQSWTVQGWITTVC